MRRSDRWFVALVGCCLLLGSAADSLADYIACLASDTGTPGVARLRDDGSVAISYTGAYQYGELDDPYRGVIYLEDVGTAQAVTPDLKTVYAFTNILGYSSVNVPFNVDTGVFQPDQLLFTPSPFDADEGYLLAPQQPLIHGNDLFVLSAVYGSGLLRHYNWQVKRYDLTDLRSDENHFVETIDPPTPQELYDIAVGPSGRLYFSGEDGVFARDIIPPEYQGWPDEVLDALFPYHDPILITSATGYITSGPDGALYINNRDTRNIERYDPATGELIDTFAAYPELSAGFLVDTRDSTIQFGVDGNLHMVGAALPPGQHNPRVSILKLDGETGELLSFTELPYSAYGIAGNRITYIPVPEPATGLMMLLGGAALIRRRRRA